MLHLCAGVPLCIKSFKNVRLKLNEYIFYLFKIASLIIFPARFSEYINWMLSKHKNAAGSNDHTVVRRKLQRP